MVLRKAIGITLMGIAIVCSMGVNKGNAQGVDESKITEAFIEAVNREVDLGKPVDELNYREVYKKLVPIFSKLVLETIRIVKERERAEIEPWSVFGALPPNVEEVLTQDDKERIEEEVLKELPKEK